jgi:hypothetical protein
MEQPAESPPLHEDPEIAALLTFTPVPRKCPRADGWSPDRQRAFIIGLAETGDRRAAAHALAMTDNGAYQLRQEPGGEEFRQAWHDAVALHRLRNPLRPARGTAPPLPPPLPPPEKAENDDEARWEELKESLFLKYMMKLEAERTARLEGRIVEADFYVRQLTWIEVGLDLAGLGERAIEMFKGLERGGRNLQTITATPISALLGEIRRAYWENFGEPERPPAAALGHHDDDMAQGEPMESQHWPPRDGPDHRPSAQREAHLRRNAEAQRAWEAKAKADADAWRAREEGAG